MSEQPGAESAESLFDHYPLGVAYDEMLSAPGAPRTAYKPVFHTLRAPCDPTNGTAVADDHLVVARGRDYEDVPPFKGIYSGRATASLEVTVSITRLA